MFLNLKGMQWCAIILNKQTNKQRMKHSCSQMAFSCDSFLYSRYWTGTSLRLRLIRESFKCKWHCTVFNDVPLHEPQLHCKVPRKWPIIGEQGWRSGDRACLSPMWPGFESWTRCHKWVEFVVGSRPCSEGFSPGSPVFLPPQKSTFLNSNSDGN